VNQQGKFKYNHHLNPVMKKLIIHSKHEDPFKKIKDTIKRTNKEVCYITFNKSYNFLKTKIPNQKVHFIDCITLTIKKQKNTKDCNFIRNPYRLDEISNAIKKAIKNGCRIIILDSLSNLLTYYHTNTTEKKLLKEFMQSFSKEIEEDKLDIIFILKKEDEKNPLIQETISLFKILEKDFVPLGV